MRRPGSVALIPSGVVAVALAYLIFTGSWQVFGIWVEPSVIGWATGFADLANQTATADCIKADADLASCDPYGRPFTPYAVLPGHVLAFIGVGLADTGILGLALAAFYVAIVWLLAWTIAREWRRSIGSLTLMMALLVVASLTPPALLLIERGQLDIIILGLLMSGLAAFSLAGPLARLARPLGALALVLSVVIKYFTVGAFATFLTRRHWSWWAFSGLLVSVAFLAINLEDLRTTQSTAGADEPKTGRVMFGASTMLVTLAVDDPRAFAPTPDQELPVGIFTLAGIGLLLALAALWWWWFHRIELPEPPGVAWYWIVGSAATVGLPYLLGPSNDYRIVFLLPLFAAATAWWGRGGPTGPLVSVSALVVLALATNAWMIPNPAGWLLPEWAMIAGEFAIAATLAFGLALFTRQWTHHRHDTPRGTSALL